MRIYRIQHKYDSAGNPAFGTLIPARGSTVRERHKLVGLGQPISQPWTESDALVDRFSTSTLGSFPTFLSGTLVANRRAVSELGSILLEVGELLPLSSLYGENYTLINLFPLFNCIDRERSEWKSLPSGKAISISRYEFDISRLPEASLFKCDLRPVEIFATEGYLKPQREFKYRVDELDLTGIQFREVWNDEGLPVQPSMMFEA